LAGQLLAQYFNGMQFQTTVRRSARPRRAATIQVFPAEMVKAAGKWRAIVENDIV
jgi:hypothetical protein